MRSFNVDNKIVDKDTIRTAIAIVCKSKRKNERSKEDPTGKYDLPEYVLEDLDTWSSKIDKYYLAQHILVNIDVYVEKIFEKILAFELVMSAELHGHDLPDDVAEKAYVPEKCAPFITKDGGNKKVRKITSVPLYPDQLIHQVLIEAAQDVFIKDMYEYCCGSVPGRGIHKGKRYIERTIKRCRKKDRTKIKNGAQLDIKLCYPSIPHARLKRQIRRKFRGMLFVWLVYAVIDSYHDQEIDGEFFGLPIGYSTSHWLCNFYLSPLDHYVKNELRVKVFVRYMDDMTLFGRSKKILHRAVRKIMSFLQSLGLSLKETWQVFRYDYIDRHGQRRGRVFDFLGFRFFRDKTIMRKRNALAIRRAVKRVGRMKNVPVKAARSLMSRLGQLRHCNSRNFYFKNVEPYINIKEIKGVIRNASRKHHQTVCAV